MALYQRKKVKTACKNGHPYTEENIIWWSSPRTFSGRTKICKICYQERLERRKANPEFRANESAKMRRWRAENPERNRHNWTENRRRKKEWLDARKISCKHCGESRPECLEFHHRNPEEKNFLLSVAVAHYSLERIQEEAEKCDILCANCHRVYHHLERQREKETS